MMHRFFFDHKRSILLFDICMTAVFFILWILEAVSSINISYYLNLNILCVIVFSLNILSASVYFKHVDDKNLAMYASLFLLLFIMFRGFHEVNPILLVLAIFFAGLGFLWQRKTVYRSIIFYSIVVLCLGSIFLNSRQTFFLFYLIMPCLALWASGKQIISRKTAAIALAGVLLTSSLIQFIDSTVSKILLFAVWPLALVLTNDKYEPKQTVRKFWLWMVVLLALSLFFHFYHILEVDISPDTDQYVGRGIDYMSHYSSDIRDALVETYGLKQVRLLGTPGITTAGLSALSLMAYKKEFEMITAARMIQLLITSFAFLLFAFFLSRFENKRVILIFSFLLVCFPYLTGLNKIINPDAILYIFSFLTILTYYLARTRNQHYLLLTAVFFSLGLLTKKPMLLIVLGIFIWELLRVLSARYDFFVFVKEKRLIISISLIVSLIILFLLWPDLHWNPVRLFNQLIGPKRFMTGHQSTYLFGDYDASYAYYLVSLLVRLPLTVWFGLVALFVYIKNHRVNPFIGLVITTLVVMLVALSFGNTIGEKYILCIIPNILFLSAVGIDSALQGLGRFRRIAYAAGAFYLLIFMFIYMPHHQTSFYEAADYGRDVYDYLNVGWGDGLMKTAHEIDQHYYDRIYMMGYTGILRTYSRQEVNLANTMYHPADLTIIYNRHYYAHPDSDLVRNMIDRDYEEIIINNVPLVRLYQ